MKANTLASMLDSTLLRMTATETEIQALCQEAQEFGCASVCVNSCYVRDVSGWLYGSSVKVCTTIGFPLGQVSTAAKVYETRQAVLDGADELDMVVNLGLFKSGKLLAVEGDIWGVRSACPGKTLKVIFETCYLSEEEIRTICGMCRNVGVDYVKTSTGLASAGATVEAVRIMRSAVGDVLGVKAAGGIRTCADALRFIEAGASRIGTSAAKAIITEARNADLRL